MTAMFQNYPRIGKTLKTLANIFIGIVAYVIATILAKRLLDPFILSFFEPDDIEYYAFSGLMNLIFIIFAYVVFVKFYEKGECLN